LFYLLYFLFKARQILADAKSENFTGFPEDGLLTGPAVLLCKVLQPQSYWSSLKATDYKLLVCPLLWNNAIFLLSKHSSQAGYQQLRCEAMQGGTACDCTELCCWFSL